MSLTASPAPGTGVVLRCINRHRLADYITYCTGDLDDALELYRWNSEITGAMWETIGHLEVALRNTFADRLAARHLRLGRPGSWLDDPARELDQQARDDITKARTRVLRNRKPPSDNQTISELSFGFWRFLLARRYATTLWPDLATGFPYSPNRARTTIERPVKRLHLFRNRLAHHQRIWSEPLTDRWVEICDLLGYIHPQLHSWASLHSRVPDVLKACPVVRPYP